MLGYACIWAFVLPMGFHKSAASLIASMIIGPPSVVLVVDGYAASGQAVAI